jgi:DNA-binding NarL/FixJ family response regulator
LQPGDQYWADALCADATGRPDLAVTALEPVMQRLAQNQFLFSAWYPSRLPQMASLAMRAGNRDQAEIAATAAAVIAKRNPGVVPVLGAAAHARGLCKSDTGALRDAVELLARGERPLATAAAREDLGHALAQTGEKDDAIAVFEAAYDAYLTANATRDLARVRSALHALGVRKRRAAIARPEHGWESLTSGEMAVVEVVAQGLTNREAAAQLYLSADTVNSHLRHAFAKLGIRSRVELARIAAKRERTLV